MRRSPLFALLALTLAAVEHAGEPPDAPAPPTPTCATCGGGSFCDRLHDCWCRWTAHLRTEPGPCGAWPLNRSEHTDERAGYPREVSRLAHPSYNDHESGGYVGGGSASWLRGDPRTAEEGTWGWDYRTSRFLCDPFLWWWHGQRYQGGTGAYKTDGPCAPDLPPVYRAPGEKPSEH